MRALLVMSFMTMQIIGQASGQTCLSTAELEGNWRFSGTATWTNDWFPTAEDLKIRILPNLDVGFYRNGQLEATVASRLTCNVLNPDIAAPSSQYGVFMPGCEATAVWLFNQDDIPAGSNHPCAGDICISFSWDQCTDSNHHIYERYEGAVEFDSQTWGTLKAQFGN
jgi:hypothetical protein